MKKIGFLSLTLFIGVVIYGQRDSNIDVQHYQFNVELSDASDTIWGKASVTVKFLETKPSFTLELANVNGKGKGMYVDKIEENSSAVPYARDNDKLILSPLSACKKGDTRTFDISYTGVPIDGLIISKNKYGHRTFFADNWPNRGHNWIPCADDPSDKATVEFIITAPNHYQVVANGVRIEETNLENGNRLTHWKEDVPIATKVMVIGAADFAENLAGTVDCIPVSSWVYPEDREKGFYDYSQATEIMKYYISHIGPYGYKKLANVQSKTIFGGLENANTIFYSENSVTGTRRSESLLAHEIAHQWFGNMATEKSFGHLWLSEGFATYFTILYLENKYGKDTAIAMLKEDRKRVVSFSKTNDHPVVDAAETDYMQLLNPNSYQKGGWVLHMLRKQLGDSIFWRSIREYYALYAGKNADTEDLQKVFEKISGKTLSAFFRQWLYTPRQPSLNITWKEISSKKIQVTVNQLQETAFIFPLEIALQTTSGKTKIEKLNISQKEQNFVLNTPETISNIITDPNTSLLFEEK
jgi:aminopeptidase N